MSRAICDLKKDNKSISVSLMILNDNYSEGSSIFLLIIVSYEIKADLSSFLTLSRVRKWVKQFPGDTRAISGICCCVGCCCVVVVGGGGVVVLLLLLLN